MMNWFFNHIFVFARELDRIQRNLNLEENCLSYLYFNFYTCENF